jgi:L-lactate dehydrogenase (cytochrome)
LRSLVRIRHPELRPVERRLAACHTVEDLRSVALRKTPRPVFDYVDGGAGSEVAMRRAREAYERVELHPHVLRDVKRVDISTPILGRQAAMPVVFAPTGFTRMMHHTGERAVARAALRAGIPYALSTLATTAIEDVVAAAPGADIWFQLYVWKDRGRAKDLIERVRETGTRVLVLTVDVPVQGDRLRDTRSGLTIPPTLSLKSLAQIARYPAWWANALTTEPFSFANFSSEPATLAEMIARMFDPSVTIEDIAWLRSVWNGPVVVKGVQRLDDALVIASEGVDAIVLSHHGGRQLDRSIPPLELLPQVADALKGRCGILVDSGIRSGADAAAAVAMGADAVLVGRAYLYGLMAAGEAGVDKVASLLAAQLSLTMQLLGARTVADLTPDMVSLRAAP